jgi:predicted nucleic acid-binding protein
LSVVVDANALVVLALDRSRAVAVERLLSSWQRIAAVPVALHQLDEELTAVVAVTQQLQRKSAYDAAYVVLAERLGGELWTLDGPLARNAADRGLPVRLIETD